MRRWGWAVGEEVLDLGAPHLAGMALVGEQDDALGPLHVGLLGAQSTAPEADGVEHLVQELLGRGLHGMNSS